jgi:phosphinothricin acetyltransferase
MQTTIRTANLNDLPDILAIVNHNILFSTAVYDYAPKTLADMEHWFIEKLEAKWPVFVAIVNGSVAGYATYGTYRHKEGYKFTVEHSVYVSEGHTGKGIGYLLLAKLIETAREENYHVMIGSIDASNTGSIEFHKKFGFTDAGIVREAGFKFDRWLDVQFMQLILR